MFRAVQKRDDKTPEVKSTAVVNAATHRRKPSLPGEEKERDTLKELGKERDKKFDPNTFTLCVGIKPSNARFYLHDHEDVAKLLQALAICSERMGSRRRTGGLASILSGSSPLEGSQSNDFNSGNNSGMSLSGSGTNFMQSNPSQVPVVTMKSSTASQQREQKASASQSTQISQVSTTKAVNTSSAQDKQSTTTSTQTQSVKPSSQSNLASNNESKLASGLSGSKTASSQGSLSSSKRQNLATEDEQDQDEQEEEENDVADELSLGGVSKQQKGKSSSRNLSELAS
jgi:hypothetical protein